MPCSSEAAGPSGSSADGAEGTRGVITDGTAALGEAAWTSSSCAGDVDRDASADSAAVSRSSGAVHGPSGGAGDAAGSESASMAAWRSADAGASACGGCERQSGAAPVLARPDEWQQALDYASGCFYYYREATQVRPSYYMTWDYRWQYLKQYSSSSWSTSHVALLIQPISST